jgi:GT2 family glycosyltransferase
MGHLSIIIVNTGTRELTCQCLKSIYANPPHCECEVIVVDNASTDGSCEVIETLYPKVHLIRSDRNLGFCGANNLGFQAAQGQHYMLLNNDTVVLPGALDRLLREFDEDATVGVVAPKLLYPDGSVQMSYGPMPSIFVSFCSFFDIKAWVPDWLVSKIAASSLSRVIGKNARSYLKWSSPVPPQTMKLGKHLLVSGACMLIRGRCFEQVGALDQNFFMYVDDADYCKRVYDAGWDIKYIAEAVIVHIKGGTVGQRYRWTSAPAYYSVFYFLEKHRGWIVARAAKAIALCSLIVRWTKKAVAKSHAAHEEWKLLRQVAAWPVKSAVVGQPHSMRLEAGSGQAAD